MADCPIPSFAAMRVQDLFNRAVYMAQRVSLNALIYISSSPNINFMLVAAKQAYAQLIAKTC